jgi:DNA-directed RNA polymerase specialized sigma subunit
MIETCNYCTEDKLCYYHAKIEAGLMEVGPELTERELAQRHTFDEIAEAIGVHRGWIDPRDGILQEHMGTIKSVVMTFTNGADEDRWNDLHSAALVGAAKAIATYDGDREAGLKGHIRTCARNAIIDELRKIQRWENETPISKVDAEDISEVTHLCGLSLS